MMVYRPWLSVTALRTFSMRAGLEASTVTPGSTPPRGVSYDPCDTAAALRPRDHGQEEPHEENDEPGSRSSTHGLSPSMKYRCYVEIFGAKTMNPPRLSMRSILEAINRADQALFRGHLLRSDRKRALNASD